MIFSALFKHISVLTHGQVKLRMQGWTDVLSSFGAKTFSQEKGKHGGRGGSASQCHTIMFD